MSNFYDQLCETFIRPSRQVYNTYDLGQPMNKNGKRSDFHVYNNRQQKIMCSFFSNSRQPMAPCLMYLHSLNGSRLESISFATQALEKGLNFCCFDFSGTGLSQGKYVSLGFFEKFDIQAVLDYVCQKFLIKKFILWGRSMGAAAAIKFLSMLNTERNKRVHYQIKALILDSPFHSLSEITIQIAKQRINLPEILIKVVLSFVKSNIEEKVGFKLSEMELLEDIKVIKCPVLLLTSKNDKLVDSSQSQKIYETISHKDREIVFIKGQHNSNRQQETIDYILNFACQSIKGNRLGKQPLLVKSSKLLHYKPKNNLAVSSVMTPKSSSKIKNTSFENIRVDTCDDEELETARWDEQITRRSMKNVKPDQNPKFSYIYSPQMSYQERKPVDKNISMEKQQYKDSFIQRKLILNEQYPKCEKKMNCETEKKIEAFQKTCLQINKSPIKQPPKMNLQKKILPQQLPSNIKTPQKIKQPPIKNYREKLVLSQKRQPKYLQIKTQTPQESFENDSGVQVNHFNVINQKLKKKKKKDGSPMKICSKKRNISVSMQRKSELPIKSPPELLRMKNQAKII